MSRRTRLVIVAISLLAVLLVATELILRVTDHSVRARLKEQSNVRLSAYVPDPDLGALLIPWQTIEVVTPEFTYTQQTDHAGFVNLEPWPAELDVAVLGNSLIMGSGVGYQGRFTTLLGQKLGGRSVLNFGIHGGGTGQQLLAYRKFAAALHPKLVISTLWLVWEIDNSLKFEDWADDDPRADFTNYRLSYGENEKKASDTHHISPLIRWKNRIRQFAGGSRLLRAAHDWIRSLHGIPEPDEEVVLDSGDVMLLSESSAARLMQGWERSGTPDLRELFYSPLESLQREVKAHGGTFLVVLFPSKEELYDGKEFPELLEAVKDARVELEARGIATLDLYPVLGRPGIPPPFYGVDMHPNASGHRLVADALAKWVAERKIFAPEANARVASGG